MNVDKKTVSDNKDEHKSISSLQGFPIKRVQFHQAFTIFGAGTESSLSVEKQKGIELLLTTAGVVIKYKGSVTISPLANVIVCYE